MSGATEGLSHKIAGARDLHSIVRAMKAMAASSIGEYERAVEALEQYYRTVELGLTACLKAGRDSRRPSAGPARSGAVFFGSDQGLVGRFNEALVDHSLAVLDAAACPASRIWAVGVRIQEHLCERGYTVDRVMPVPQSADGIGTLVGDILIDVERTRETGGVDQVQLFYTGFHAGKTPEPAARRLLPLDLEWRKNIEALRWPTPQIAEIIEGRSPALDAFIREYLFIVLFQACAQSLASENACRLAAMQRAEKNIDELLEDLTKSYRRQRQESIDEELFDVIAGARLMPA